MLFKPNLGPYIDPGANKQYLLTQRRSFCYFCIYYWTVTEEYPFQNLKNPQSLIE